MFAKRLPTILGLGFLLLAMGALVFLWQTIRGISSKAAGGLRPRDIRVTNKTSTGFTFSYFTSDLVKGSLNVEKVGTVADIRDQSAVEAGQYNVHYFDIRGLDAGTGYQVTLETGDQEAVSTLSTKVVPSKVPPLFGNVARTNGLPVTEGIVFLTLSNGAQVSGLIKNDGSFLIPLSQFLSDGEAANATMTIFVQTGTGENSSGSCSLSDWKSLQTVVMGKVIPCAKEGISTGDLPASRDYSTATTSSSANSDVVTPSEGETLVNGLPTFRGKVPAGKVVSIEVHSEQVYTGTAKADDQGNWSWSPSDLLSVGAHTLTVSYIDENGQKQTMIRNFTVRAAGNQSDNILPATVGTPSASVTITATPIPTVVIPVVTKIVTPISTVVTTPTTAEGDNMIVLLTAGTFLVILGSSLVLNYAKRTSFI